MDGGRKVLAGRDLARGGNAVAGDLSDDPDKLVVISDKVDPNQSVAPCATIPGHRAEARKIAPHRGPGPHRHLKLTISHHPTCYGVAG
jgi:hypothetical protein